MRLLCALVVTTALLTACSSAEDAPAAPNGSGMGTSAEPTGPTSEELEDLLLTTDDLAPGFTVDAAGTDEETPPTIVETSGPGCHELWDTEHGDRYAGFPQASVSFSKSALGPYLHQTIVAADDQAISEDLDLMSTYFEACPAYATESDGLRRSYEFFQSVFPAVGDRSVGIDFAMTISDGTNSLYATSTLVLVQVGPNLLMIGATHFAEQELFGEGEMAEITRLAVERLETALD